VKALGDSLQVENRGRNKEIKDPFWMWCLGEGVGLIPEVIPAGDVRAS